MKNRWIAWLLTLTLLISMAGGASAEDKHAAALPGVGEVIHGFEVTELGSIELISAPTVLFTHQKTGAQLLYIAAQDINRSFDISFRTPALDNRGAPHVFEHATLCGSEKYPYQNIVYALMSQAYSTFVNASTYTNFTTYPVASLSEDQLFVLADVYMDAVFHPMILQDERIYRREAWRYELTDSEAPLSITGTVYSEMKGATTIMRAAYMNLMKALMPGSTLSNNSGGEPSDIPELTYQQLTEFHEAYYHPSNALIILYGELDCERFLQNFDEQYLSKYDKREFVAAQGDVALPVEPVDQTVAFPVEQGSPSEDASYIFYGFALPGISQKDALGMSLLSAVLNHESSPFMQRVRAQMPGKEVFASVDTSTPEPFLYFMAIDVDEADKALLKRIADESIAELIEQGVDLEVVDALLASTRFSQLTIPEMQNLGVGLSPSIAMNWVNHGSTNYFNEYLDNLDAIEAEVGGGYLKKLAEDYLTGNPHSAIVATVPQPGLAEQNAAVLAQRLADVKAEMSEDELQVLVEQTQALAAWSAEEIPQDQAAQIKVLDVASLPDELDHYEVSDETVDGVRYLKTQANVGAINATTLMLDTSGFPVGQLHDLELYTGLLGMLGTNQYTREQLETLILRYLNSFSVSANQYEDADDVKRPALSVNWMGLSGEYEHDLKLVEEILFRTNFSDTQLIQGFIERFMTSLKMSITNAPYSVQMARAAAAFNEADAYAAYMGGIELYKYYGDMLALLKTDPAQLTARLEAVQQALKNRRNAIAVYTASEDGLKEIDQHIAGFFERLPDEDIQIQALSGLPRPSKREALIIDSQVQYNLIYAPLDQMDLEDTGRFLPISQCLNDTFFMPKLRHEIGVYSILQVMGKRGFAFVSYRDPSIAETFNAYEQLPAFARDYQGSQADLDSYIISSYSGYAMPKGALTGASFALSQWLNGKSDDYTLNRMREIKQTTPGDLTALSDAFEILIREGARSTAGGAAMIEQNKDLYDQIIDVNQLLGP